MGKVHEEGSLSHIGGLRWSPHHGLLAIPPFILVFASAAKVGDPSPFLALMGEFGISSMMAAVVLILTILYEFTLGTQLLLNPKSTVLWILSSSTFLIFTVVHILIRSGDPTVSCGCFPWISSVIGNDGFILVNLLLAAVGICPLLIRIYKSRAPDNSN